MHSRTFKYIVHNELYPVLFTEADTHSSRANDHKVTSAGSGELAITPDGQLRVSCWGQSVGLNINSRPEQDADLIHRMFVDPMLY